MEHHFSELAQKVETKNSVHFQRKLADPRVYENFKIVNWEVG
jgi:hypothetical protein